MSAYGALYRAVHAELHVQVRATQLTQPWGSSRYWAAYALNATQDAIVIIENTRISDTLFGGLVVGGRAALDVVGCEFLRNEPSIVILEDAVLRVDACGFSHHSGKILQVCI